MRVDQHSEKTEGDMMTFRMVEACRVPFTPLMEVCGSTKSIVPKRTAASTLGEEVAVCLRQEPGAGVELLIQLVRRAAPSPDHSHRRFASHGDPHALATASSTLEQL